MRFDITIVARQRRVYCFLNCLSCSNACQLFVLLVEHLLVKLTVCIVGTISLK